MPRTKGYSTNGNRDLIVLNKDRLHTRRHHRSRIQKTQRRVTRGRVTRGRVTRGRNQRGRNQRGRNQKTQRRVTRGRVTRGRNQRGRNQRGRNQRGRNQKTQRRVTRGRVTRGRNQRGRVTHGRNQKTQRRVQRGGIVIDTGAAIGLTVGLTALGLVSGGLVLATRSLNKRFNGPSETGSDAVSDVAVSGSDTASSDASRESETLQPGMTTREERMEFHDRINSLFDILVLAYQQNNENNLSDEKIRENARNHIDKIIEYYNGSDDLSYAENKELKNIENDTSNPLTREIIKKIEKSTEKEEDKRVNTALESFRAIRRQAEKAFTGQKTEAAEAEAPAATAQADEKGAATAQAATAPGKDEEDNGSLSKRKLQLSF